MSKEILANGVYHADINYIFESYLKKEDQATIRIVDVTTGDVIMKMNYEKVLFDSDMNIYKKTENGFEKLENPNFKAVALKK